MSYKCTQTCRKCSVMAVFLLLLQSRFGHINFAGADEWLKENLDQPSGRAVLVILKDRKTVYEKSVNDLSRKLEMMTGFIMQVFCL